MNPGNIAAIFAIAVAIMGLGTAVVIGLRGNALKADLDRVRQANDDLDAEIARKDRHTAEQDELIASQGREIVELKAADVRKTAALARIGEAAISTAEIREMVKVMGDHDREAAARHASTIKVLRQIRDNQEHRKATEEDPP